MYYEFLWKDKKKTDCEHIIVVAGNHDSPSLIDAPKELLSTLDVRVVGVISENIGDDIFILNDKNQEPMLIVCAVPYLRERDIRCPEEGETTASKENKIVEGIRNHYNTIAGMAAEKRKETGKNVPIVVTGHLFAAGGQTIEEDGVRDIYVGNLGKVESDTFSELFDYVALGHLHIAQKVNQNNRIRYCGSPIPMGFGESKQQKIVNLVKIIDNQAFVEPLPVPTFRHLETIKGDKDEILLRMEELGQLNEIIWIEIIYTGDAVWGNMAEEIEIEVEKYQLLEIIRIKNQKVITAYLSQQQENESLDDLNEMEIFERCLIENAVPDEQREEMRYTYQEIVAQLHETDLLTL
jgi:exonuclease SbcD